MAKFEASSAGTVIGSSSNLNGITVGVGAEKKLSDRISVKAEYSFLDFESEVVLPAAQNINGALDNVSLFSVGINYGF